MNGACGRCVCVLSLVVVLVAAAVVVVVVVVHGTVSVVLQDFWRGDSGTRG